MLFTKPILVEDLSNDDFDTDIEDSDTVVETTPIVLKLIPDVCGVRLDKAVAALMPQYSRSRIQQWIEAGHITVDGKSVTAKMTTFGDETITVLPQPSSDEQAFTAEEMPLSIVYEDADIIVVDKPAGLVVHPAAGNWSGTLLNGLLFRWPSLMGVPRAGIVHRLDKDTSGLMVIAKHLVAQTDLVRQLQARTVKRQYLALVWGLPQLSGIIDRAIGRHPHDRIKMAVLDNPRAKPAITRYQRLATGLLHGHPVSLMRCQLETGRTHQIRVHMQSLGFSLVGDAVYGKQHLMSVFPRQALQASRLGLIHPSSATVCEWFIPLPDDFAALLTKAGITIPE